MTWWSKYFEKKKNKVKEKKIRKIMVLTISGFVFFVFGAVFACENLISWLINRAENKIKMQKTKICKNGFDVLVLIF